MDDTPDRARWIRYALATAVGISLLGMAYVLFDPDLGTPLPLFQELTCRGRIDVTLTSAYYEPHLRIPETGIYLRGRADGETLPVFARIQLRDANGDWTDVIAHEVPRGEEFYFLSGLTPASEARVSMKAMDGSVCEGVSITLPAREGPYDNATRAPPP